MTRRAVKVKPGTHPTPDSTALSAVQYVDTDKVFFRGDKLCKYPGWSSQATTFTGAARSIASFNNGTYNIWLIGTHKRLYARINGTDTNITPLLTTTTAIANSIDIANGSTNMVFNAVGHLQAVGDRVKIAGAANFDVYTAATHINIEHIITAVTANTFTVVVAVAANPGATSAGGAGTTYAKQIAAGDISQADLIGFGGGDYDEGDYDEGGVFTTAFAYPRIWSFGRYGDGSVAICPGGNGIIYGWSGSTTVAPVKITNSPTALWISTRNNAIKARGAGSVKNMINISGVGAVTAWTPGPTTTSYADDWEEAGRMISDAYAGNIGLIFTENMVIAEEYVDLPKLYRHETIMRSDGILGPMARIEIEGQILWAGNHGFYLFNGEGIEKIKTSVQDYIFASSDRGGNLNRSQRYNCFWEYDPANAQAVFHFPAGVSSEPNEYCILHMPTRTATLGTRSLTAAEQIPLESYRLTAYGDNTTHELYRENSGVEAGSSAMSWHAESHWRLMTDGGLSQEIMEIYPDATQTGDITLTMYAKDYARSTDTRTYGPYTISPTTERICPQVDGHLVKYRWASTVEGGDYREGSWMEDVQPGTEP